MTFRFSPVFWLFSLILSVGIALCASPATDTSGNMLRKSVLTPAGGQISTSSGYQQRATVGQPWAAIIEGDSGSSLTQGFQYPELLSDLNILFQANVLSGTAPLEVSFENLSVLDGVISCEWDFNGDDLMDSQQESDSFIYDTPGTYSVTLTISRWNQTVTLTRHDYIQVFPEEILPYDAEIVSHTIPATMQQFQRYTATITVRNTGTETWMDDELIYYGLIEDQEELVDTHFWRVDIFKDVNWDETVEFAIEFNPQQSGIHSTKWQMLKEGEFRFGDEFIYEIMVERQTSISNQDWQLYNSMR